MVCRLFEPQVEVAPHWVVFDPDGDVRIELFGRPREWESERDGLEGQQLGPPLRGVKSGDFRMVELPIRHNRSFAFARASHL